MRSRLLTLAAVLSALLASCRGNAPEPGAAEPARTATSRPSAPTAAAAAPAAAPAAGTEVVHVDPDQAAELLESDPPVAVLDVRTPQEFAQAHIPGALNVDFRDPAFAEKLQQLDRNRPYLVHCRSGRRSTAALPTLEKLGFRRVYHLDGGILAWEAAGKPTEAK